MAFCYIHFIKHNVLQLITFVQELDRLIKKLVYGNKKKICNKSSVEYPCERSKVHSQKSKTNLKQTKR